MVQLQQTSLPPLLFSFPQRSFKISPLLPLWHTPLGKAFLQERTCSPLCGKNTPENQYKLSLGAKTSHRKTFNYLSYSDRVRNIIALIDCQKINKTLCKKVP